MTKTLAALIAAHPDDAQALGAPGRAWLNYSGLRSLAADAAQTLHRAGIGRGDRVAIVLPNGPEMATAFLTVAQVAITAPLNPGYKEDEYAFYLDDLKAKALIVLEGDDGPAIKAAAKLGIAVLRLSFDASGPAGTFILSGDTGLKDNDKTTPAEGDVALILHTSGTTSRPKIVPLTQANLYASALNIRTSLALTSGPAAIPTEPGFCALGGKGFEHI